MGSGLRFRELAWELTDQPPSRAGRGVFFSREGRAQSDQRLGLRLVHSPGPSGKGRARPQGTEAAQHPPSPGPGFAGSSRMSRKSTAPGGQKGEEGGRGAHSCASGEGWGEGLLCLVDFPPAPARDELGVEGWTAPLQTDRRTDRLEPHWATLSRTPNTHSDMLGEAALPTSRELDTTPLPLQGRRWGQARGQTCPSVGGGGPERDRGVQRGSLGGQTGRAPPQSSQRGGTA